MGSILVVCFMGLALLCSLRFAVFPAPRLANVPQIRFNSTMANRQLRLFEHPKPLLERFGVEFFRAIPKSPGVYIMSDGLGRVLYVGQSTNLRTRLGTYRRANPDHTPRRVLRLIHAACHISWEQCEDAACAQLRENELLRIHRPRFNRMNVYPRAYGFIGFELSGDQLTLFRATEADPASELFGAFKGAAVSAFGSLLRLLWSAIHRPRSPFDLPRLLINAKPPARFTIQLLQSRTAWQSADLPQSLHSYFDGKSSELVPLLAASIGDIGQLSLFHQNLINSDLETLTSFFETGPARNRRLKREYALHDRIIPQEELDDWIVLSRGSGRNAPSGDLGFQ